MRVSILLRITADDGTAGTTEEVASFEKATERPEDVGLSLADGKALLTAVQRRGPALAILCSDHGTAYGEDGYFGHRVCHPVVWTVPYAEFVLPEARP